MGGSLKWRKFIRWRVAVGIKMGWVFADMGCTILAHDADSYFIDKKCYIYNLIYSIASFNFQNQCNIVILVELTVTLLDHEY